VSDGSSAQMLQVANLISKYLDLLSLGQENRSFTKKNSQGRTFELKGDNFHIHSLERDSNSLGNYPQTIPTMKLGASAPPPRAKSYDL
jgi:hypothetical protein